VIAMQGRSMRRDIDEPMAWLDHLALRRDGPEAASHGGAMAAVRIAEILAHVALQRASWLLGRAEPSRAISPACN
jgi:hypothetical protein